MPRFRTEYCNLDIPPVGHMSGTGAVCCGGVVYGEITISLTRKNVSPCLFTRKIMSKAIQCSRFLLKNPSFRELETVSKLVG